MISLDDKHKHDVIRFCKFFVPDAAIYLFGSRANGTDNPRSDLDIALESAHEISHDTLMQLRDALNNTDIPFHIDIVNWNTTPASFRALNQNDRVLLSS